MSVDSQPIDYVAMARQWQYLWGSGKRGRVLSALQVLTPIEAAIIAVRLLDWLDHGELLDALERRAERQREGQS